MVYITVSKSAHDLSGDWKGAQYRWRGSGCTRLALFWDAASVWLSSDISGDNPASISLCVQ